MTLSGFPASGFRTEKLDGTPPWDVAVMVDNQPIAATAYAESTETLVDAPVVGLSNGEPPWVAGIIGDTKLRGSDAATNDVDFYRIDLPDGDHYALNLQVLAQRFGSLLDAAVSLLDSNGQVLATNDDALHEGFLSDSELYTGLNGGTYYVAVSAAGNLPSEGGFDPLIPGSGHTSRGTTGQYLLRLNAAPDTTRPEVVDTSIDPGATLDFPPTEISVQFSEPMNLRGLEQGATLTNGNGDAIELAAISYDSVTYEVTYVLLDRPVAGDYQFTLHASVVKDRADNPIDGGALNGDFTLEFHLDTPSVNRVDTESNETVATAQQLGPLFVNELRGGVQITGVVSTAGTEADHDFYRFQVTRPSFFTFRLRPGQDTTQTGLLRLRDADGTQLAQGGRFPGMGSSLIRWLTPGEYVLEMDGSGNVPAGSYQLTIQSAAIVIDPLRDNDPGPTVQVILRTRDGERPPESKVPDSTESSTTATSNPMIYSVDSLPAVASQPAGRPQPAAASSTELAWVDQSSGGQALPAGFVLGGAQRGPAVRFSVAGVSGSFHDALPDAVPHGMHALNPSTQLLSELAVLVRGGFGDGSHRAGAGAVSDAVFADGSGDGVFGTGSDEWIAEAANVAMSPSTFALGMVASIGAASVMTVPNRRRTSNWVQRAVEWLGLT